MIKTLHIIPLTPTVSEETDFENYSQTATSHEGKVSTFAASDTSKTEREREREICLNVLVRPKIGKRKLCGTFT